MIQISVENSSSRECLIRLGWVPVQCKCSAPYYSFTVVIYKSFRRIFLTIFCCLVQFTLLDPYALLSVDTQLVFSDTERVVIELKLMSLTDIESQQKHQQFVTFFVSYQAHF